ncbi:MAG: polysaccharide pyruvyl transferase family protein [Fusobacteriaceae bacterium]|nr:polysaccharide pyruvyl transferase family protein [Fusobacteriaceae bacterium]MBN2837145.1 polysaccharide pyruvyl transferase family protein [Fusobacteriaceae bacterium]
MKKNVLVIGWYGEGNIGDEAILQSIKNNLTEKFDVNVKALSTRTEYTTRMQGVEAIPHMPLSMKSFVLNFFNIKKSRPAINAIRNSDIILLGGGGFLSDWSYFNPFNWLKYIVIAKYFNKKTMLYAIGAGPFRTKFGKFCVRYVVNKFIDKITVRDEESRDWLKKAGVTKEIVVSGDPVISLNYSSSELNIEKDKQLITFVLNPYLKEKNPEKYNNLKESLIDYFKLFTPNEHELVFLPFENSKDYEFNKELIIESGIEAKLINLELDPNTAMNILAKSDLVVSLRLHGNIMSASCGTPFLPIVYHHKTAEFIKKLGWEYQIDFGEGKNWIDADLNPQELFEKTIEILNNRIHLAEKLDKLKNDYCKFNDINLKEFEKLINN